MLGPLTEAHLQLFLKNSRFVGLKFPDMSRPETLQKRFVGKVGIIVYIDVIWYDMLRYFMILYNIL